MTKRNCIRIALLAVCLLGGLRALHYVSAQEGHKPGNAHTSANTQAKAAASSNSDAEVRAVLTQYAAAVERGDLTAIEKLWSKDETVTVIENGPANYGWADYRDHHLGPELKEMKNVKYSLTDIKVNLSGHTAWATFKYTIAADLKERHVEGGGLGTAVLQHGALAYEQSAPRACSQPREEELR